MTDLVGYFRAREDAILGRVRELVEHESPSTDKPALDALARRLRDWLADLGAEATIVPNEPAGDHVDALFTPKGARPDAKPALVLCHFDTVWPIGTADLRPFRVEEGRAYGPGIFDMKTSIAAIEAVLRGIRDEGWPVPRPIRLVLNSDEEVGSGSSRALIESRAREAAYVLVLESPLPGGVIKTARKGTGRFALRVEGRAAHAGLEPEKGISAIEELAHQILRLHALTDRERETTVNVGVVRGGTRANVVADTAEAEIDVRVWSADEGRRITDAILGSAAITPGARVIATGGLNRPPMEPTPAQRELFERARAIAAGVGIDLQQGRTGGASDGNFTAGLGVPTLDGLGVPGAGAHAAHEHVEIEAIPPRVAFLAALLHHL